MKNKRHIDSQAKPYRLIDTSKKSWLKKVI